MKVLVNILNFNLPEYTDVVYECLEPYKNDLYDIMVMDNGSTEEGKSKYTTHETGQNVYFGGGLNIAFQYMLDNKEYDYLLFLNNDIVFHGQKFVQSLVRVAEEGNTIVSPCIIHPEQEQNYWPVMHNWGMKNPRTVKWVDFTSPLIHRRLIEEIKQFDDGLMPGFGYDNYCAMVCEDMGWKISICDFIPIVHLNYMTLKLKRGDISGDEYHRWASNSMFTYYDKIGEVERLHEQRNYAKNYKI